MMLRQLTIGAAAIILSSGMTFAQPAAGSAESATVADQVHAALKQLDASSDKSAATRITLAKIAIKNNAWEAARDALADAARLEPGNAEAAELMQVVAKNLPATPPQVKPPVVTPPPSPATKPSDHPAPSAPVGTAAIQRQVTPAEINRIRQLEWKPTEMPTPSILIDADTRKKFLASTPDITPAEFNKMSREEQASKILASGKDEFTAGVVFKTDPASIKEFKTGVNRLAVQSCGSCHVANKAGNFSLYTDKSDAAIYSNFMELQNYQAVVGGVERLVVDRTNPEGSLLAQFLLPTGVAEVPHPNANGFVPPSKTVNDVKYQQVLKWLKNLDATTPKYGIDLTKAQEPATPPAKGK